MSDWYAPLRGIASLGATAPRPRGRARLHLARQHTLSQFFTPDPVAQLLWSLVQPAMDTLRAANDRTVTLFDNSSGSGRLFQFAHPDRHRLYGIEVHQPLVDAVSQTLADAGFQAEIVAGPMEEHRAQGFDVGLINPPFNLAIDNPRAEPFPSGSYGAYGPASSHRSHTYALDQARAACGIVAAIMPASFADIATTDEHWRRGLHAVYHLPASAFRSEGATVATCIVVYGPHAPEQPQQVRLARLSVPAKDLPALTIVARSWLPPSITRADIADTGPVITTPVTRDRIVRGRPHRPKAHPRLRLRSGRGPGHERPAGRLALRASQPR